MNINCEVLRMLSNLGMQPKPGQSQLWYCIVGCGLQALTQPILCNLKLEDIL